MRGFRFGMLLSALMLVLVVGGCGSATPEATATPTRTPPPPEPPTATPVPPTPTPMPTATVTPSPTPSGPVTVTPFPPDVNPFTGLQVSDVALLERIPLAIKVSNSPEVRPQSGLNEADLVFEHYAEGGLTRFTAIFYGTDASTVGSVRSGRLLDLEVPAMYKALFGYSGSSAGVKELIRNSDLFPTYIAAPDFGVGQPYFYRVPQDGKAFEHTLFTNTEVLRQLADERGINSRPEFPRLMAFGEGAPAGGTPLTYFEIGYLASPAAWTFDAATGRWLRSTSGRALNDALTGERVSAANVVMVYANHVEANFWEEMIGDSRYWKRSIEIQAWGQGPVLLFRDGQMYNGYWMRTERDAMLTFYFGDGTPMPLKPGNTWFQMVPLETTSAELAEDQLLFTP